MTACSAPVREGILALRRRLGSDVCIVGHHYQAKEVIEHCDTRGDSLELARMIEGIAARHIVFCGVYFMGESAAILTRPGQGVYLPAPDAECVMAKTSPAPLVARVLERLAGGTGRRLIPLAYVNSSVAVKALVGKLGGAVCTSSNAQKMLAWALEQGDGVVFLPDRNLARNSAAALGLPPSALHMLDVRQNGARVDMAAAAAARLLIWPGGCAIHARFHPEQVQAARNQTPGCLVAAHPECAPAVIEACDVSGSTTTLIRCAREARPGQTVYVGTEANLVWRLAEEQAARGVTVRPLKTSLCSCMASCTPEKLLDVLQKLVDGTAKPVHVPATEAAFARLALQRMLDAGK